MKSGILKKLTVLLLTSFFVCACDSKIEPETIGPESLIYKDSQGRFGLSSQSGKSFYDPQFSSLCNFGSDVTYSKGDQAYRLDDGVETIIPGYKKTTPFAGSFAIGQKDNGTYAVLNSSYQSIDELEYSSCCAVGQNVALLKDETGNYCVVDSKGLRNSFLVDGTYQSSFFNNGDISAFSFYMKDTTYSFYAVSGNLYIKGFSSFKIYDRPSFHFVLALTSEATFLFDLTTGFRQLFKGLFRAESINGQAYISSTNFVLTNDEELLVYNKQFKIVNDLQLSTAITGTYFGAVDDTFYYSTSIGTFCIPRNGVTNIAFEDYYLASFITDNQTALFYKKTGTEMSYSIRTLSGALVKDLSSKAFAYQIMGETYFFDIGKLYDSDAKEILSDPSNNDGFLTYKSGQSFILLLSFDGLSWKVYDTTKRSILGFTLPATFGKQTSILNSFLFVYGGGKDLSTSVYSLTNGKLLFENVNIYGYTSYTCYWYGHYLIRNF